MRCGMCQAVCPLFAETGREADVARGKLALLDGLARELLSRPQGVQDRLSRCLLCGSCAAHCPSGVKVLDIFIQARAILAGYLGLPPWKRLLFRGLLARPGLFHRLLSWGTRFQGIFIRPVDDLLGSSCSRFLSPLLGERHLKPLAPQPLHRSVPARDTAPGATGLKVAFFVGCLIDKVFPQVGHDALAVLEHHAVGVYLPPEQGCCGIPALSGGDTEAFHRLVRHHLALFGSRSDDYLVTACATCAATLRKLWPLMTQDHPEGERQEIARLAARTLDVSQFLAEHVGLETTRPPDGTEPVLLTYHDPCHLKKSLGVAAAPRALLQASPGYQLIEMAEADRCCGCGGSFTLQHYELSQAIGGRKRENLLKSGAQAVATGCPACMLQLTDLLSQAGARVQVKHTVEIYAEALRRGRSR
ncbi:MAG: (Fe-S)-binding protein [Syntrophobacterales bacterium]|nr:(Fe-S)-binding protein [Syntrophobacterales bacterium]